MSFKQDLAPYFDADNLVCNKPNPSAHWDGGNELLETGTAYVIMKLLGEYTDADAEQVTAAVRACQAGGVSGIYDKNPPLDGKRRMDNISHDDILGVAAMSAVCKLPFASEIVDYANHTNWWLTNNGIHYWDAWVKPWHKAFYKGAAGRKLSWLDGMTLHIFLACNTMSKADPSGTRLTWLMVESLHITNPEYDGLREQWYAKLHSTYGSMKNVFSVYHNPTHPFAVWCPV